MRLWDPRQLEKWWIELRYLIWAIIGLLLGNLILLIWLRSHLADTSSEVRSLREKVVLLEIAQSRSEQKIMLSKEEIQSWWSIDSRNLMIRVDALEHQTQTQGD